ncbi:hypothetical protein P4123_25865 [Pseudomonas aeruginosa]|nr:hypothetical protein [Pseudomonas aeruginosa]
MQTLAAQAQQLLESRRQRLGLEQRALQEQEDKQAPTGERRAHLEISIELMPGTLAKRARCDNP